MKYTKQEVMDQICVLLGISTWRVSTGSTEPKGFLLEVASAIGLNVVSSETKTALAKMIVEAGGGTWLPTHESQGATITLSGLEAIELSVRKLLEM